ncbi:MAG: type II toxin-antitoxin system VapC family toxin [Deltaproteobacteria bacterium]|nr:type II toxin-antitoxin system VapC family toxin [Deltaproteobacteria bacterium]
MKLLLDTPILLWSLLELAMLSKRVASELEDPSNEIWVSPVSIWEVLVLAEKGRVILNPDPLTWIRNVLRTTPLKEAPLNHEVAIQSRTVDLPHQDPVDRFLATTVFIYDLTLVTTDKQLLKSRKFAVLANK